MKRWFGLRPDGWLVQAQSPGPSIINRQSSIMDTMSVHLSAGSVDQDTNIDQTHEEPLHSSHRCSLLRNYFSSRLKGEISRKPSRSSYIR